MIFQRSTRVFDLFDGLAAHAVSSAERLRRCVIQFPDPESEIDRIHDEEHAADKLMHDTLEYLVHMPPIDADDVHTLAGKLDDIIDFIDALAQRLRLYHIDAVDPLFAKQADLLVRSTVTVRDAVHRLRKSHRLSDLGDKLIEIHRLESESDDNHHAALSRLFDGTSKPLFVLKWKEIHTMIENAIDACEDVGNILERIVLKNA